MSRPYTTSSKMALSMSPTASPRTFTPTKASPNKTSPPPSSLNSSNSYVASPVSLDDQGETPDQAGETRYVLRQGWREIELLRRGQP